MDDKWFIYVGRYRFNQGYDEISMSGDRTQFWLHLQGYPEVEITEDSFTRWFSVLFPNPDMFKYKTVTARYGDADIVRQKFLP